MRNFSRAFRRMMFDDERVFLAYADITLSDNTVLHLTNEEIWGSGFSYDDAVSEDNSFTAVGSVIIGSAEIVINNIYEDYSAYDFMNADVVLYIGLMVGNAVEREKIGTYRVDDASYNGATIRLSLLDNIEQFDRPYSLSNLTYPATLFEIVNNACYVCGVSLANNSLQFPHYNYSIPNRPEDESLTFREVISWCATIAGCFVKCNANGQVVFSWFDTSLFDDSGTDLDGGTFNPWTVGNTYSGGTFNPWTTGNTYDGGNLSSERKVHYITGLWSQNIATDDTVITGVAINVVDNSENASKEILTYSVGTPGYEIQIEANDFITKSNVQTIINWLGVQLIGLRFRKVTISHISDPSIESGDVGYVIDRKQNIYRILITHVSFSVDGNQTTVCGSETPARNSATKYSGLTKSFVETRKQLRQERTAREAAIAILEQAISESAGLYTTIVTPQTGGNIYYLHDKADLADSKIVWKMNRDAWAVTNDWQGTDAATTAAHKWNAGLTVDGTLIAEKLSAVGVDADWINTGAISVETTNHVETFYANVDTGVVRIKATSFSLTDGSTIQSIAESKASAAVSAQTQASIFNKLTNNGQTQGIYLSDGKIYINFTYAKGGTLKLGGNNNGNGLLEIYDSSNTKYGSWNNEQLVLGNDDNLKIEKTGYIKTKSSIDVSGSFNSVDPDYTTSSGLKKVYTTYTDGFMVFYDLRNTSASNNNRGTPWIMNSPTYFSNPGGEVSCIHLYTGLGNLHIEAFNGVDCQANFVVRSGFTKSKAVDTQNYGERLLYCYETPTPYFGDIGFGQIDSTGECIISIDDIFREGIAQTEYMVFLQKEGPGDLWVEEKDELYFVVKGTPNLKFSWELKAPQLNFEDYRLEDCTIEPSVRVEDNIDSGLPQLTDYLRELDKSDNDLLSLTQTLDQLDSEYLF